MNPYTRARSLASAGLGPVAVLARAGDDSNFPSSDLPFWLRWARATEIAGELVDAYLHAEVVAARACRADAWDQIVADVLDLDLPAEAYDVAIDVLHDMAAMPCTCETCMRVSSYTPRRVLLPVSSSGGLRESTARLVRARYDQAGRYRFWPTP